MMTQVQAPTIQEEKMMTQVQAPALDPTIQVPLQDLPLQILRGLEDRYGDVMKRAFEHIEERRFASQDTCTITRPLTPLDLADVEIVKPEPAPRHDRRIVNDRGDVVSLEKGYFSGHPEPIDYFGKHRGEMKDTESKTWRQRGRDFKSWLERQLKKVGLAYDE